MTNLLIGWVLFGLMCLLAIVLVFLTGAIRWLIYPNVTEEDVDESPRAEPLRPRNHER